jgi:CxxH/CxxC protein (TIGR04129 family)
VSERVLSRGKYGTCVVEVNVDERGSCMYVVCKDHLEIAIDEFVDEYEEAPDIVDLEKVRFSRWEPPVHCEHCKENARFLVV